MDKQSFFKKRTSHLSKKSLAMQLDLAKAQADGEPKLQPPPGEFNKIIQEMERRNIETRLEKELRPPGRKNPRNVIPKPVLLVGILTIIMSITAVGVSAKRAYNYRARERQPGDGDIVWNNDEYIIAGEDDLDKSYLEIEKQMGIMPLILIYLPFDMKFSQLVIEDGQATIEFTYLGQRIYFIQASLPVRASSNSVSDRGYYKEVFNEQLQQFLVIEKNELPNGNTEFSCYASVRGVYCYLSGIMEEDEFIKIVERLGFQANT